MYTMKMTRKSEATTEAMTNMKAMMTTKMTLAKWQKRNKRLGVVGTVVVIVIHKK